MPTQPSLAESGKTSMPSTEPRTNDSDRGTRSGVERTEMGLWLIIVGLLLSPEPYTSGNGSTLIIIGFIMVALGRSAFGQEHSWLVFRSTVIFFLGLVIDVANFLLALYLPYSTGILGQYEIGSLITVAVSGIAILMLTYILQKSTGRILLWAGYVGSVTVNILLNYAYGISAFPYVFPPVRLNYLYSLSFFALLNLIPASLSATAFYLAWKRINKGEIPKQPEI